jgi:hypothetical protein
MKQCIHMAKNSAKRFLSIRLSQDEFDKIQQHLQKSTCRSLTEYAKKLLTREPVIVRIRDQSREDILHRLGVIKSLLEDIPEKIPPDLKMHLLDVFYGISLSLREIAKTC